MEEVELEESLHWMFGVEEEDDNDTYEEDEFLGLDLESLLDYEEVEGFDSDVDIEYFEALLVEESEKIVAPAPDEETKCGDHSMDVVEEEGHHCRPVEEFDDGSC
ncbi:MAG: hypothetical protein Q8755_02715 [Candidatus Phytoplasma australasiaticum]|nr:hypothetical protein [Candidatus Phytoplasma australasiaticum]